MASWPASGQQERELAVGDHIGFRLRRIDATAPDITGEYIVYDITIKYKVNKVFKTS